MGLIIYKDFIEIDKKTVQVLINNGFLNGIHLNSDDGIIYIIGNSIIHIYQTIELNNEKEIVTQHIDALNPVEIYSCHISYNKETKDIVSVNTNFKSGEQDLIVDSIEIYLKLKVYKINESWRDKKYEN